MQLARWSLLVLLGFYSLCSGLSAPVLAGEAHVKESKAAVTVVLPEHQGRLNYLPVPVRIQFAEPVVPESVKVTLNNRKLNGSLESFSFTTNALTGSLNIDDGLRPSLGKDGRVNAPNTLRISARTMAGKPIQAVRHFFLNVSATAPSITGTVSSGGGTVVLPGYAEVTIAPDTFSGAHAVQVSATTALDTARDWDATAFMFDAQMRSAYEVRINTGYAMPAKDFQITLDVPDEFLSQIPEESKVRLFAQFFEDGGEEILDSFELVDATYSAETQTLTAILPANLFTERRTRDATFEAVLVIGTTPTKVGTAAPKPGSENNWP